MSGRLRTDEGRKCECWMANACTPTNKSCPMNHSSIQNLSWHIQRKSLYRSSVGSLALVLVRNSPSHPILKFLTESSSPAHRPPTTGLTISSMGNIHTNTVVEWWRDDLLLVPTLRLSHHGQSRRGGTRIRNDLWSRSRKDHPPQQTDHTTEEQQKDGFDTCQQQQQQQYRHEEDEPPTENHHHHHSFQHLSWLLMISLRNVAMGCFLLLFGLGTPRQHTKTIRKCWTDVPLRQKLVSAAGLVVVVALLLGLTALPSVNDDWWWWWTTTPPTTTLNMLMEALRCGGSWYVLSLETHPMATKSLTAGVIQSIGDYLAQWVEFALEPSAHHHRQTIEAHQREPCKEED